MTNFIVHTKETAPQDSKPLLAGIEKAYGFIPNISSVTAESPVALEAYGAIAGIFEKSEFSATEKQIILMTNNRLNGCKYCMAAHSTISHMQGVPADAIETLRTGSKFSNPKLEALRVFAAEVNIQRGDVTPAQIKLFLSAGYTKAHILEVIVGTAMKVLTNYTNHVAETPVDGAFHANVWQAEAA